MRDLSGERLRHSPARRHVVALRAGLRGHADHKPAGSQDSFRRPHHRFGHDHQRDQPDILAQRRPDIAFAGPRWLVAGGADWPGRRRLYDRRHRHRIHTWPHATLLRPHRQHRAEWRPRQHGQHWPKRAERRPRQPRCDRRKWQSRQHRRERQPRCDRREWQSRQHRCHWQSRRPRQSRQHRPHRQCRQDGCDRHSRQHRRKWQSRQHRRDWPEWSPRQSWCERQSRRDWKSR